MRQKPRTILSLIGAAGIMLNGGSARAGTVTYTFDTDPATGANAIEIYQAGFADSAGTSVYWKAAGGNPGGFLGLTWPLGGSSTIAIFPDIDPGKVVTAFTFETDLRIGNPQQNVRAADGFSINFARSSDPVFENHASSDFATGGAVETGTQTGLAICFDTWSGNTLPDGADIEGIIVRVDNKTVLRQPMPTRNGACDDTTSLQTGPRQDAYWDDPDTGAKALGTLPDAAFLPETWTNLCWQKLVVDLDVQGKLTVTYKGLKVLDAFQTTFFPSAGRIVLAGRTGGADEHGHFDNLKLTTTATTDATPPTPPANPKVASAQARKVVLTWDAATDDSGKVAYNIERDGTIIASFVTGTTYVDRAVEPGKTYSYKVQSADPAGNKSVFTAAVSATTPAEVLVDVTGVATFETWADITGTAIDGLTSDARFPDSPTFRSLTSALDTRPVYPDDSHENYGGRLTALLTPTETADYDFFLRSDDASQLFLSTDATAANLAQLAEETGCCDAFHETGAGDPETTGAPIRLTAGKAYLIQVLWKEGGGGDYAQVAWRKAGDTTAAANLSPIPGSFLSTKGDPTAGPPVITKQPTDQTVEAGGTATFSVEATIGEQPVTYQWQLSGADIPGASAQTLTVNNAGLANSGAYTVVVSNSEGSARSSAARLTIRGLPTILFVHATTGPNDSDLAAMARIKSLGWQVTPVGAVPSQTSDADGKALIVISSTVASGEVGDKFHLATVPNVNWEAALLDNFDQTDRTNDADTVTRGVAVTQTQINIVKADHPLAAGLSAGLKTYLNSGDASWGVVGPGATVVGTIADDPTHASLYVYEKDATLFDGSKALAREVHFPGGDASFLALNADGLKLFDAAILYAAGGGTPSGPKVSIARTATGVAVTFEGTLQAADKVTGPYSDVAGAASPYNTAATAAEKYFRSK